LEAATSTTHSEAPPKTPADPSEWSIEDVIQHIAFIDPALGVHADLFRKHVSLARGNVMQFQTCPNSSYISSISPFLFSSLCDSGYIFM